jgi:DNA repair exonuclease SbcCD nuclease subunit
VHIALTADLHLTRKDTNPERFQALKHILDDMVRKDIQILVIAGDLFHQSDHNYLDFDRICSSGEYGGLRILVIPGNHDLHLKEKMITAGNVRVVAEPRIIQPSEESPDWLFVPYIPDKDMGSIIAEFSGKLQSENWIVAGHGDWIPGQRTANPMEPGIYMPMTSRDVTRFQPLMVFLGHVHKSQDHGPVHIPGSPCPMDITETGLRRFLVLDTVTRKVESVPLIPEQIFFDEIRLLFGWQKCS